eukprot:354622-Chlamydomonas_euryale.AAC.15
MMRHAPISSRSDIQRPCMVGRGSNSRPTPYNATMKKCITSTLGFGLRPDSSDTGPAEYMPPSER